QLIDNAANPRISGPPLSNGCFLRSTPKKENTDGVGAELLNQFFHFLVWIYLLPVFGERCNPDEEAGLRIAENMVNFQWKRLRFPGQLMTELQREAKHTKYIGISLVRAAQGY